MYSIENTTDRVRLTYREGQPIAYGNREQAQSHADYANTLDEGKHEVIAAGAHHIDSLGYRIAPWLCGRAHQRGTMPL